MRGGRGHGRRAGLGTGVALLLAIAGTGLLAASGGTDGPVADPSDAGGGAAAVVTATSVAAPSTAGSDASLAGRVAVSPVLVRLEIVPRKPKSKGPIEVRATVTNLSAARLPLVAISVSATPASLLLKPAGSRSFGSLAAGHSTDGTWSLCSTAGGTFQLVATATTGSTTTTSRPITIAVPSSRC